MSFNSKRTNKVTTVNNNIIEMVNIQKFVF